jgi:hypothetical protein
VIHPRAARERDDLLLLAAALLAVPAGWLLLGWRWPLCVSGYDAWATALPLLRELVNGGGDWSTLAWRPDLMGGTRLRDSVGPNPLAALLARAGFTATGVYNLCLFALQAFLGFLGARTADDLARTWGGPADDGRPDAARWMLRLAALACCAFAPWLGWRAGYGHLGLTTGVLPFAAALALVAAAGAGTLGATLAVVALAAAASGLLFTGHQLVIYGALFGGPLLAGIWLSARVPARSLAAPLLILAAALALAWPGLHGVIAHGLSGDSPRTPRGLHITYSYLTAGLGDWLSSIPWTFALIPAGRPPLHFHESNVPLGPLAALLFFVPWRAHRPLAWGAGASLVLVLAFSMDVRPLSTLMIWALPPLGSFRVPTRAALPLAMALPCLAVAAALARRGPGAEEEPRRGLLVLAGPAAAAALLFAPAPLREGLGWAIALALFTLARRGAARPALVAAAVVALAGGTVGAFGQRLLRPFFDTDGLLDEAARVGAGLRAARPELRDPLVRVALRPEAPALGANTAFAGGLSSIEGYFFPSGRLLALVCALRHQPYNPSAFVLRFAPEKDSSRAVYQLFDVAWQAHPAGGGPDDAPGAPDIVPAARPFVMPPLSVTPFVATAGPAWFAARVERSPSIAALAETLLREGDVLHRAVHGTAWVLDGDAATAGLPAADAACAEARVTGVSATPQGRIIAQVETGGACPLTFAATYAEALRGQARVNGAWQPVRLFPAHGALLAAWVPAGATEVTIDPGR